MITWRLQFCLLGCWPLGQNPAGATSHKNKQITWAAGPAARVTPWDGC